MPISRMLLDNGADTSNGEEEIQPPLLIAAEDGRTDLVKLLLDKGADINYRSQHYTCGVLEAVSIYRRGSLVPLLIERGVDVSASPEMGTSPLSLFCVLHCQENAIKALVEAGADVQCRDAFGHTVLHDLVRGYIVMIHAGFQFLFNFSWREEQTHLPSIGIS